MPYTNSWFIDEVNEHIHSERDRNILIDRFVNGLTVAELSAKHNISERQIARIIRSADPLFFKLMAF